jgi:hypothetical protein
MATILPPDQGDWGALLGQSLGQGIGQGLMGRRQREQTMQGLEGLGLSPEQAQNLSMLPQDLLGAAIPGMQKESMKMNIMNQARSMAEALGVIAPSQATPFQEQGAKIDTAQIYSPSQKKQNIFDDIESDIQQRSMTSEDPAADTFKSYLTNLAMTGDPTVASQLTSAQDKSRAAGVRGKETRKTSAINKAREDVKKSNEIVESSRRTFSDYDQIAKAVKSSPNKWIAGVPFSLLKRLDIEKGVLDPGLALANKAFEAQPVQALKALPAQSARLGKVFESLKNMHGSLQNRPDAIQAIARVKKSEAKIDKIINSAFSKAKAMYIDADQTPPANLEARVVKSLKSKLEPHLRETEFALSDALKEKYPEITEGLKNKTLSEDAVVKDQDNGVTYKLGKIAGRMVCIIQ